MAQKPEHIFLHDIRKKYRQSDHLCAGFHFCGKPKCVKFYFSLYGKNYLLRRDSQRDCAHVHDLVRLHARKVEVEPCFLQKVATLLPSAYRITRI